MSVIQVVAEHRVGMKGTVCLAHLVSTRGFLGKTWKPRGESGRRRASQHTCLLEGFPENEKPHVPAVMEERGKCVLYFRGPWREAMPLEEGQL